MPAKSRIFTTGSKLLAALAVSTSIVSQPHETNLSLREDWKCYQEPQTLQKTLWRRSSFKRPQIGQITFARVPSWRGLARSRSSRGSITSITQLLGETRPSASWTGQFDNSELLFHERCDSNTKGTTYVNSEASLEDFPQGTSGSTNSPSQNNAQSIGRVEKAGDVTNTKYNPTESAIVLASLGINFQSLNDARTGLISVSGDGSNDDENRNGLQNAFSTTGIMDVGFVWTFHEECINLITNLLPLISHRPTLRIQNEVLKEDVRRLFLWGESFRNGKLEMVLSQSEELKDIVLEFITAIGLLLTDSKFEHFIYFKYSQHQGCANEMSQELYPQLIEAGTNTELSARVDDFKNLIEKAQSLTKNSDSPQDDWSFETDSETSSEISEQAETNVIAEINAYVNCLMDLLPSMDHVLALNPENM